MRVRIKICCISSVSEAMTAINHGADAVGLVGKMPGGLNPDNVRQAIEEVKPYGIDVCSGVRTNGVLDENKLSAFMTNAREYEKQR